MMEVMVWHFVSDTCKVKTGIFLQSFVLEFSLESCRYLIGSLESDGAFVVLSLCLYQILCVSNF
jgi:hypothetical protein